MIKTSRSRLEIRQEPDLAASLAGVALTSFGLVEVLHAILTVALGWVFSRPAPGLVLLLRAALGAAFAVSGWFFLRGRSRVVLDLEHRMVASYLGVGGRSLGGNRTWDIEEFAAVILIRRRRRTLFGGGWQHAVSLARRDGDEELEIHSGSDADEAREVAGRVAEFLSLPLMGAPTR